MAYLRSCYSTQARFFYDSTHTDTIVWYWAAEGAPRFSGRHTFYPLSFSGGSTFPGSVVGEQVGSPRPWRDGSNPVAPASGVLDGIPSQFYLGQSVSDPGIERTDFGIPVNCAGPEPGVYCAQSIGFDFFFDLQDLLGTVIGHAIWSSVNSQWSIVDLLGDFRGYMLCYNYGTLDSPLWALSAITNLWTGSPGQFKPYPLDSLGPVMLFQSIATTIGPAVGKLVQNP